MTLYIINKRLLKNNLNRNQNISNFIVCSSYKIFCSLKCLEKYIQWLLATPMCWFLLPLQATRRLNPLSVSLAVFNHGACHQVRNSCSHSVFECKNYIKILSKCIVTSDSLSIMVPEALQSNMQRILSKMIKYRKVCARLVP